MNNTNDIAATLADCASKCEYCAEACLHEENIKMLVECIQLDRDCADICRTAMNYVARDSKRANDIIDICGEICAMCAEECEKHSEHHDHCKACAKACRECEEACKVFSHV